MPARPTRKRSGKTTGCRPKFRAQSDTRRKKPAKEGVGRDDESSLRIADAEHAPTTFTLTASARGDGESQYLVWYPSGGSPPAPRTGPCGRCSGSMRWVLASGPDSPLAGAVSAHHTPGSDIEVEDKRRRQNPLSDVDGLRVASGDLDDGVADNPRGYTVRDRRC